LSDIQVNVDNELSLRYTDSAIAIGLKEDLPRTAYAMTNKGELLTFTQNYSEAVRTLDQALELALEHRDTIFIANAYGALGGLYENLFDHERSLEYFTHGVALARTQDHMALLAKLMNNMANLFEVQGEYALALKTFIECADILEAGEQAHTRAYYVMNMNAGMMYLQLGQYSSALQRFSVAKEGFMKLGVNALMSNVLSGISRTYKSLGQMDSAFHYHSSIDNRQVHQSR